MSRFTEPQDALKCNNSFVLFLEIPHLTKYVLFRFFFLYYGSIHKLRWLDLFCVFLPPPPFVDKFTT